MKSLASSLPSPPDLGDVAPRLRLLRACCGCVAACLAAALPAQTDLRVSANGHYLETRDGTPFQWIGGTPWGLAERLDRAGVDKYLRNRADKGFTVVQVCALWGKRSGSDFTVNPQNAYGHRAFDGGSDPDGSSPRVVSGGGPDNPNDFWDHLDYVVREAEGLGLHVALLPAWGRRYVNADHPGQSRQVFTADEMDGYGEFLGERYGGRANVIFVLGGDVNPEQGGSFTGHYRRMAEGIVRGATGSSPGYDQPSGAWDDVMLTYHPFGRSNTSSTWFHDDEWLDFNMSQIGTLGSRLEDVYPKTLADYDRSPTKPIVHGEGAYEGEGASPLTVRRQALQSLFAGAAGHTYGHTTPVFSLEPGWDGDDELDAPGAADVARIADYLRTRRWHEFVPDNGLLTSGEEGGAVRNAAVRAGRGDEIYVYFADGDAATVDLSAITTSGTADAEWFNPDNGATSSAGTDLPTSGTRGFDPPYADAILRIAAVDGGGDPAVAVTGVTVANCPDGDLGVAVGGSLRLEADVLPADATEAGRTWGSSNAAVATVDASGRLDALAAGTTTIAATTTDGGFEATCEITVLGGGGEGDNPCESGNLAPGASIAESSGEQDGNPVTNLNDGVTDADANRWSSRGMPQWVILDLGASRPVDRVAVVPTKSRRYVYDVYAANSLDAVRERDAGARVVSGTDELSAGFGATDARYVRFEVTGASNYDGPWVSLREVEIYGACGGEPGGGEPGGGSGGEIVVRAAGDCGTEAMALSVAGEEVARWTNVGTGFANYTYAGYAGGEVEVAFVNDLYTPGGTGCTDRNLSVDYVEVCGQRYQTETAATEYSNCCKGDEDKLYTNGRFDFGDVGCATAGRSAAALADPGTATYGATAAELSLAPNPAPRDGRLTVGLGGQPGDGALEVRLFSADGALWLDRRLRAGDRPSLDLAGLPPGAYYVRVSAGDGHWVRPLAIR